MGRRSGAESVMREGHWEWRQVRGLHAKKKDLTQNPSAAVGGHRRPVNWLLFKDYCFCHHSAPGAVHWPLPSWCLVHAAKPGRGVEDGIPTPSVGTRAMGNQRSKVLSRPARSLSHHGGLVRQERARECRMHQHPIPSLAGNFLRYGYLNDPSRCHPAAVRDSASWCLVFSLVFMAAGSEAQTVSQTGWKPLP